MGYDGDDSIPLWGKVIDNSRCIGCHACSTACKSENEVPLSVDRTFVKYVDIGTFPEATRNFQVTRCNQCSEPPCAIACPTAAMFQRPDGIVDFDKDSCIGCKACIAACPYDAIFINPDDHTAEKCNFCAHRVDLGLEPACVVVCPTEAIRIGDLRDPDSDVFRLVARDRVQVRRPEKGTRPKLFYRDGHQSTLDPLAARRPEGGLYLWSEQEPEAKKRASKQPPPPTGTAAAAMLAYDVPHRVPWDWRVSLYTWTKGISAGFYLVALALVALGTISRDDALWLWWTPLAAGLFLAATGALLISDLSRPTRFYYVLIKPQWQSWLVRGAFIISGFAAVLTLHFGASLLGLEVPQLALAVAGVPLAVLTAVYTAYLFAQARARDLWQNPLLPPHFLVQAGLAGAAALLLVPGGLSTGTASDLSWALAALAGVHVGMVLGEITLTHPTAHAKQAAWQLVRGQYAPHFWLSVALVVVAAGLGAVAGAWDFTPAVAAVAALIGLALYEHAYVQSGQSVPLA